MNFRGGGEAYNPAPVRVFSKFTWLGLFVPFLGDLFSLNSSLARYRFENKSPKNFVAYDRNNNVTNSSPFTVHSSLNNETAFSLFTVHFSLTPKPAFTIAEVLITLGVIGIVAAMLFPNVLKGYQKMVLAAQLKKFVSVFSQAHESAYAEYGSPSGYYNYRAQGYYQILLQLLSAKDVTNQITDSYKKDMDIALKQYGSSSMTFNKEFGKTKFYQLKDGSMIFYMEDWPSTQDESYLYFMVDTNGQNRPNSYGKDLWVFLLFYEKPKIERAQCTRTSARFYLYNNCNVELGLVLSGAGYSEEDYKVMCKRKPAKSCLDWVRINGWNFPKDYPW